MVKAFEILRLFFNIRPSVSLKKPSHLVRGVPTVINCLATLLKEPVLQKPPKARAQKLVFLTGLANESSSEPLKH
ncbi:hypothetical protein JHK87_010358 [Glycine soja]|nr:hypothetical protein JHK87_010358 [Glycine soja]